MSAGEEAAAAVPAGGLRAHPRGLFYLAFTEAWERFSYYGQLRC